MNLLFHIKLQVFEINPALISSFWKNILHAKKGVCKFNHWKNKFSHMLTYSWTPLKDFKFEQIWIICFSLSVFQWLSTLTYFECSQQRIKLVFHAALSVKMISPAPTFIFSTLPILLNYFKIVNIAHHVVPPPLPPLLDQPLKVFFIS